MKSSAVYTNTPHSPQYGFGLVEVVVGITIITVVSIFISLTVMQMVQARAAVLEETQRLYLAEEGYEIVRYLRDQSWSHISDLVNQQPYTLTIGTSTIEIEAGVEQVGDHVRIVSLLPVYRLNQGTIVAATSTGAFLDERSRFVRVEVADGRGTTTYKGLLTDLVTP